MGGLGAQVEEHLDKCPDPELGPPVPKDQHMLVHIDPPMPGGKAC